MNKPSTSTQTAPRARPPLSAVVITRDCAGPLRTCLASLRFCDEMLVVDSGSRDDTVSVAQAMGARVLHQDWLGFGPQKQFAVSRATHAWVLCVDADEEVSPELGASIEAALGAASHDVYACPRRNHFLGRPLRHGEGYPDWSVRLFDRRRAHWSDDAVHERVITTSPVGRLRGDLLHHSAEQLQTYLAKQERYTDLQAARLHAAGKRVGLIRMLLAPALRFVKFYVVRLGFLDGWPGLVHVAIGCRNSYRKYAKLRRLARD